MSTGTPSLPADTPPDIVAFYDYWLSLAKTDLVPSLSDYLDHAPPQLQPFVGILDVLSPTESRVRLYGAGLTEITGSDPTGGTLNTVYPEHLRAMATKMMWEAVSRPVGYLCVRDTRTQTGLTVHSPSICLPLLNSSSGIRMILNYSHMPKNDISYDVDGLVCLVTGWRLTHWIDVGAGTPDA